jgi:beta-phosphoglucomutase
MLKAVIFDFDGVIVDTEHLHLGAFNKILAPYGVNISHQAYYDEYVIYNDVDFFTIVSQRFELGFSKADIAKLVNRKFELFKKLIEKGPDFLDGAQEFISLLKKNDIIVAICSGSLLADIDLILKKTALQDAFEVIVGADSAGVTKGKPDPVSFEVTLARLNENRSEAIDSEECVVIEDSYGGLVAAAAAGMHRVAVTNTFSAQKLSEYAEMVVDNLRQIDIEDLKRLSSSR